MRKLLLLLLASGHMRVSICMPSQSRTITGKVTAADGSPVPNASIVVKGSSFGTTTESDGTPMP